LDAASVVDPITDHEAPWSVVQTIDPQAPVAYTAWPSGVPRTCQSEQGASVRTVCHMAPR
jgi:hypothetical protein